MRRICDKGSSISWSPFTNSNCSLGNISSHRTEIGKQALRGLVTADSHTHDAFMSPNAFLWKKNFRQLFMKLLETFLKKAFKIFFLMLLKSS